MRAAASDRLPVIQLESRESEHLERLLSPAAVVQTTQLNIPRRTGVGQLRTQECAYIRRIMMIDDGLELSVYDA